MRQFGLDCQLPDVNVMKRKFVVTPIQYLAQWRCLHKGFLHSDTAALGGWKLPWGFHKLTQATYFYIMCV